MFSNNEGVTGLISASIMSGIKHGRLVSGIELGFNDYEIFNLGSTALYGKYNIFKKEKSPYGYGLMGYGAPLHFKNDLVSTNAKGGMLYGAGVGLDIPIGKIKLLLQMGYKFQKVKYQESTYYYYWLAKIDPLDYGDDRTILRKMGRIEFKIGIQF